MANEMYYLEWVSEDALGNMLEEAEWYRDLDSAEQAFRLLKEEPEIFRITFLKATPYKTYKIKKG